MAQMKINVLITGKDALGKEGLFAVLAAGEEVTAAMAYFDPEQLLKKISEFQPDILLFSVSFFDSTVLERIRLVKKMYPDIKALLFMSIYDERFVIEGLNENVDGFLLDNAAMDAPSLLKKIYDVYHEQFVLSGEIAKTVMLKILYKNEKEQLKIHLMKRQINVQQWELDFLYLLLKKYSDKKIAALLELKEKTIYDYLSHFYRKIGIYGREELISYLEEIAAHPGGDF